MRKESGLLLGTGTADREVTEGRERDRSSAEVLSGHQEIQEMLRRAAMEMLNQILR